MKGDSDRSWPMDGRLQYAALRDFCDSYPQTLKAAPQASAAATLADLS